MTGHDGPTRLRLPESSDYPGNLIHDKDLCMVPVLNSAGRLIERPGNFLRNLEGHKRFVNSTAPFDELGCRNDVFF